MIDLLAAFAFVLFGVIIGVIIGVIVMSLTQISKEYSEREAEMIRRLEHIEREATHGQIN